MQPRPVSRGSPSRPSPPALHLVQPYFSAEGSPRAPATFLRNACISSSTESMYLRCALRTRGSLPPASLGSAAARCAFTRRHCSTSRSLVSSTPSPSLEPALACHRHWRRAIASVAGQRAQVGGDGARWVGRGARAGGGGARCARAGGGGARCASGGRRAIGMDDGWRLARAGRSCVGARRNASGGQRGGVGSVPCGINRRDRRRGACGPRMHRAGGTRAEAPPAGPW